MQSYYLFPTDKTQKPPFHPWQLQPMFLLPGILPTPRAMNARSVGTECPWSGQRCKQAVCRIYSAHRRRHSADFRILPCAQAALTDG